VLQQLSFTDTERALPNHKEIHALQSLGELVPWRGVLLARPRVPPFLINFARDAHCMRCIVTSVFAFLAMFIGLHLP